MSDMELVRKHIQEAKAQGSIISHGCARTIAGMYHSGQFSPSYAFLSSGAIEAGLFEDMFPQSITGDVGHDRMADAMREYIAFWSLGEQGRGPVEGWDNAWVDKPDLKTAEQVVEPMPSGWSDVPDLLTVEVTHTHQWYKEGDTYTVFYDGTSGFRLWQYGRPGRGWIMPEHCRTLDGEGQPMIYHKHEQPQTMPRIVPKTHTVMEIREQMNDLIHAGRANQPVYVVGNDWKNERRIENTFVSIEGKVFIITETEGQVDAK